MTEHVTVAHTWEAGHRLPHLPGKCTSLHGHSWRTEVTVSGHVPPGGTGILVEFAALKKHLRGWIDANLDHGLMLGVDDPLLDLLEHHGKTFPFGSLIHRTYDLRWPTVENVAVMLSRVVDQHLQQTGQAEDVHVSRVDVQETAVNRATWTRL